MTGEQALTQPAELSPDDLLPPLSQAALRRERLIRSLRWPHLLVGILATLSVISMAINVVPYMDRTVANLFSAVLPLLRSSFEIAGQLALFYFLSRPQPWTRRLLLGAALYGLGAFSWDLVHFVLERMSPTSSTYIQPLWFVLGFRLQPWTLLLSPILAAWLAFSGPGREVYSKAGLDYFANSEARQLRDNLWITFAYSCYVTACLGGLFLAFRLSRP